jgi:hypothetical protein
MFGGNGMNYRRAFVSLLCALLFMGAAFVAGGLSTDISGDHDSTLGSQFLIQIVFWPATVLQRFAPGLPRAFDLPVVWFSVLVILPLVYGACLYGLLS